MEKDISWMHDMPRLGFGMMRLPQNEGAIDHEQVCSMVDAYMRSGMNYFDTAYVYHGGLSEIEFREAVVKRYPRESYRIATKLPAWAMHSKDDRDRIFQEQLEKCGVDFFDCYLLHSIEDGSKYETYEAYDCFRWGEEMKKQGKILHFGFSFHGSPALLRQILDLHPEVDFVQIQLNYADWNSSVVHSGELYEILHSRDIPVIVMEPVKGGILANLRPELEEIFHTLRPEASDASWALRFVSSLPGVMTVLSGMSTQEQMQDNLQTMSCFEPLSEEEMHAVREVRAQMQAVQLIECTACRYCTDGCPMKISIPDIFSAFNAKRQYPTDKRPNMYYRNLTSRYGKACDCIACGQCEGICPQHLPIIELLRKASELFDA